MPPQSSQGPAQATVSPVNTTTTTPSKDTPKAMLPPPSPSQSGHSDYPKSVKDLTCFYWASQGWCKWGDDECLYAHYKTGKLAQSPKQVEDGRPAVAGKNASSQAPTYRNWRAVHTQPISPEIQEQIKNIRSKANNIQGTPTKAGCRIDSYGATSTSPNHAFEFCSGRGSLGYASASYDASPTSDLPRPVPRQPATPSRGGSKIYATSSTSAYPFTRDQPGSPDFLNTATTYAHQQDSTVRPSSAYSQQQTNSHGSLSNPMSQAPSSPGFYGGECDNHLVPQMSTDAQAQMITNQVITAHANTVNRTITYIKHQTDTYAKEIVLIVRTVKDGSIHSGKPSMPVSADATSPPYGNLPTPVERVLKSADKLMHMIKENDAFVRRLENEKWTVVGQAQRTGATVPFGWVQYTGVNPLQSP